MLKQPQMMWLQAEAIFYMVHRQHQNMLLRLRVDVCKCTDQIIFILKCLTILNDLAEFANLDHLLAFLNVLIANLLIEFI